MPTSDPDLSKPLNALVEAFNDIPDGDMQVRLSINLAVTMISVASHVVGRGEAVRLLNEAIAGHFKQNALQ